MYKHDTGYADDNTVLMSFYRNQLNEAEKAIDENLRVLPLRASNKLSNLQIKMSKAGLIENSQSVNLEALNAKKSDIIKVVKEKQTAFENAERDTIRQKRIMKMQRQQDIGNQMNLKTQKRTWKKRTGVHRSQERTDTGAK